MKRTEFIAGGTGYIGSSPIACTVMKWFMTAEFFPEGVMVHTMTQPKAYYAQKRDVSTTRTE